MENKKHIVFFITTVGHGKGGHFFSLSTIASSLKDYYNITIVNFGSKLSPVLIDLNVNTKHIFLNGKNFIGAFLEANKFVTEIKADYLNAFDLQSYSLARLISSKLKTPIVYTKCGGPNPQGKYFPKSKNLVLFSIENNEFFIKNKKFKNTKTFLIPNRVETVNQGKTRIQELKKKHDLFEKKILLRISRIGKHYQSSIEQGIKLTAILKSNNIHIIFLIIGTIQDSVIYEKLKELRSFLNLEKEVIFETGDTFTKQASELLPVADFIIGTGRNFMEACYFNKLMLVPYKNTEFPLLVNNNNFSEVFKTNFSPRTQISEFDEEINLRKIQTVFKKNKVETNSKKWFLEHFGMDSGKNKYIKLFDGLIYKKYFLFFDTILNILYTIKTFVWR